MLGDYELLVDAIPLREIERVLSFDIGEQDKKRLISYVLAKRLEGITLRIPRTRHKVDFASFLVGLDVEREMVMQTAEIARRTYYKIKAKNE